MPLLGRPPGPSPADLRAMPSRRPAIVLSIPLAPRCDSHPDSGCADGSRADVNDASRFGLSRARRDACGVRRIESDDGLPRGRFFLIVAGRFPAVKNNLNLIRTTNKAGGCSILPMRIARTPGVERGNELAHAAHDLPRPSAATQKWCSEMVILGPFRSRFTKPPRRSFRTNVRNMFIMHRLNIISTHMITAYRKRLRNGSLCAKKRRL